MIVMALDPGAVTGVAVYDTETGEFKVAELPDLAAVVRSVDTIAMRRGVIVIEKYVVTDRTSQLTQQTDALKITGALADVARRVDATVVYQTPADAKRFSTPAKLKALGWHTRTRDQHADDAARHLLRFLERNKLLRPEDRNKLRSVLRGH